MMLGCIGLKPQWILSQGQNSQVNTSDLLKIPDGTSTLSLTGVTEDRRLLTESKHIFILYM